MHKIRILLAFPEIPESALPVISMPQGNDIQEPHKEHPADEGRYIMLMEGSYCDLVHLPSVNSRSIIFPPFLDVFWRLRNVCSIFEEACTAFECQLQILIHLRYRFTLEATIISYEHIPVYWLFR